MYIAWRNQTTWCLLCLRMGPKKQLARFQWEFDRYKERSAKNRLHILGYPQPHAKRHSPISLEVVWATKWWPNRVFAFILPVTEVNAMLAYKHFCKYKKVDGMLGAFRKLLAEVLLCSNPYYKEEESPGKFSRLTKNSEHRVFRLPKGNAFSDQRLWMLTVFPSPKYMFRLQRRKTRTWCICSMGVYHCVDCCLHHSMEAVLSPSSPDWFVPVEFFMLWLATIDY